MITNMWNAKTVVSMLQSEHPALVEWVLANSDGYYLYLPDSSPLVLKVIIEDFIFPNEIVFNRFNKMGVEYGDWLGLNKKTYEWVKTQPNINELIAFRML